MKLEKGLVISLGGSSIFDETGNFKDKFLSDLKFLQNYKNIIIVVGGGIRARKEIKKLNDKNMFFKDLKAIEITKQNAEYFANKINYKFYNINNLEKLENVPDGKICIGGLIPIFSTDAVASLIAELKEYDFVNLTNVNGIYDKNPKEFHDAKMFNKIEINDLIRLIFKTDKREPGTNAPLDLISLLIIRRSKIKTFVGKASIENITNLLEKNKFNGTKIVFN